MKAMSREQLEALVEQVAEQLLQIPPPNSYWELGIGYREWAADRARNVVAGLGANYMVVPLPEGVPERRPDWRTPLISDAPRHMFGCRCGKCPLETPGKPLGHGWSCKCDRCDTFNRSVSS